MPATLSAKALATSQLQKKNAGITVKKQTVHCAYFVYSALTRTVWTHALTYKVQAGAYKNFYIYRNWRVVLFCFPLDNTKTDERNLSCFFLPANQRHTFEFCRWQAVGTF